MIALTGSSGFLGRHLTLGLAHAKFSYRALVRPGSKNTAQLAKITPDFHEVDYQDFAAIRRALKGCQSVIHTLGVINADQATLDHVNGTLAERVALAAKEEGCEKIIHISSVAAAMRHGPYGESKLKGENFIRNSGIPYTIFRPAYIYGAGDENNTALLIRTLKRWPVVPLLGGGSFKLQPVYVKDAVDLILKSVQMPAQNSEFNLAGPAQVSLEFMLKTLSQHLGKRRFFMPIPLRPVQQMVKVYLKLFPNTRLPAKQILELDKHEAFSISKTRDVFDFDPVPYEEGVKRMFEGASCAG